MGLKENILYSNCFGSVTDKRVILNYKNGQEDIPINQITSVSYRHQRNIFFIAVGFLLVLIGIFEIFSPEIGGSALIGLILIAVGLLMGIAHWFGHHNITISSGGKDRKSLKAELSKTKEGREFVEAVRKSLVN